MDWILEKVFELVKDILKGDFSDLDKLPALIAVRGLQKNRTPATLKAGG